MGEQEVRDQDRLRRSKVCIRRHQRVAGGSSLRRQGLDHFGGGPLKQRNSATEIQTEVQRDLLIPRTPCMEPFPCVSQALDQQAFHEAVNIFVRTADEGRIRSPVLENRLQRRIDGHGLLTRQDASLLQRPRPREASRDVVLEQATIETEGRAPLERGLIGGRVEAAGPESRHQRLTIGIITGVGAVTALRPTMEYAPLKSFNRTMPEIFSCTDSTNPSSALRSGENHKPL